uniref:Lamin-B receptor-like n=1 Tax=Saccoglossus kowalevskii TaxID=10224 RepID=A0ABM0M703_SACKO|nr:PREDICTED: lamin-B receptor-like [Saccoglossus kowalevskii]
MKYRQNGFLMLILTLALVGIAHHFDKLRIAVAYEKRLQLITISTVISFLFSVLAFIKSKWAPPNSLSPRGNSGKVVYDFFVGHELHPRICKTFDLKMFVYRVGLIQLTLLNLVNIGRMCQSEGKPTIAILFAAAFMGWYVLDSFWFEDRIVHCLEFSGDGFGFRLIFGCLTVMPFFMSFPTWYLIQYSPELSKLAVAGIVVFQLVGMVVYRGSNSQKWEFRRNPYNPKLAHLESIRTNAGTRLLVSGWWGCVRHPNYLGDILLTIGFVLPCGCAHFLPWILPVTCIVEQVVREIRDSEKCRKKYGSSWNEYCEKVKYRLVPYIY